MRNTITAATLSLFMVLSGAGLPTAGEARVHEKMVLPQAPEQTGPVPRQPGAGPSDPKAPVELPALPVLPDKTPLVEIPALPVLPAKTPLVEIPAIPVLPQALESGSAPPPPLQQETTTTQEAVAPRAASPAPDPSVGPEADKQPSPLDFLPMPALLIPDNVQSGPRAEKGTPPDKARPRKPKAQKPPQSEQAKAEAGAPLRIPPGAAKSGDLSFLEGCWRGTRPEYHSKRTITERFCFDKNGHGQRIIDDPQDAVRCTGAAQGSFDTQGRLIVTSEQAPCTTGPHWGQAYMVCQGEGAATPCFWRFPDVGGASQSYKIPLVRE